MDDSWDLYGYSYVDCDPDGTAKRYELTQVYGYLEPDGVVLCDNSKFFLLKK